MLTTLVKTSDLPSYQETLIPETGETRIQAMYGDIVIDQVIRLSPPCMVLFDISTANLIVVPLAEWCESYRLIGLVL